MKKALITLVVICLVLICALAVLQITPVDAYLTQLINGPEKTEKNYIIHFDNPGELYSIDDPALPFIYVENRMLYMSYKGEAINITPNGINVSYYDKKEDINYSLRYKKNCMISDDGRYVVYVLEFNGMPYLYYCDFRNMTCGFISDKVNSFEGGSKVSSSTIMGVGNTTVYAQWTLKPLSGWVLASNVPSSAQIVENKWTYTRTQTTESTDSSLSGWNQIGSYWVESGSGSANYASFPSGYDTGDSIYTSFMKSPYTSSETATTKRTVTNNWAGYVYWHWMYSVSPSSGYLDRAIYYNYGYASAAAVGSTCANFKYQYFQAFKSTTAYSAVYKNWNQGSGQYLWYNCTGVYARSSYFYRFDYYTSTYTDYYKVFQYQKVTTGNESSTQVTAGGEISNVQHYVRYREK